MYRVSTFARRRRSRGTALLLVLLLVYGLCLCPPSLAVVADAAEPAAAHGCCPEPEEPACCDGDWPSLATPGEPGQAAAPPAQSGVGLLPDRAATRPLPGAGPPPPTWPPPYLMCCRFLD
jgi:hypothetical protein